MQNALITEGGLDDLYTQVLSRVPRDDNFDRVLGTVILVRSPLPINFLGHLLRIDTAKIVHTLLGIQSILLIPGNDDQAIQLFHTSLRDFLMTPERSRGYFIEPLFRHLHIASDCLLAIREPPTDDIFFDEGQKYACVHWFYHLWQALAKGGQDYLNTLLSEMPLINCLQDFAFDFWFNTVLVEIPRKVIVIALSEVARTLEVSEMSRLFRDLEN